MKNGLKNHCNVDHTLRYFHELRLAKRWHSSITESDRFQEIKIYFHNGAFWYIGFAAVQDSDDNQHVWISTAFGVVMVDRGTCKSIEIDKGMDCNLEYGIAG